MIHNIDGISQTVQYQGCMIPISWELKMNERIKELKQQAADYVDSIDNGIDIEEYRKLLDQKFAELIVQECIDQCADNGSNDEWDKGVRWAANQIKEHFGVAE
jgi:uncharacterized UPF0160 family protein